jgi:hypothetical protein
VICLDPPYPCARVQPGDGLVSGEGARYPVGEDLLDEPLALVLYGLRSEVSAEIAERDDDAHRPSTQLEEDQLAVALQLALQPSHSGDVFHDQPGGGSAQATEWS